MRANPVLPSDRSFGVVFGVVFALVAGWGLWMENYQLAALSGGATAVLLLIAGVRPHWLSLPNRVWFKFGVLLSRIMSPVVMAVIYFFVVLPMGLLMRLFVRDDGGFFAYGKPQKTAWHDRTKLNMSDDFTKQH